MAKRALYLVSLSLLSLTACDRAKEELGLNRHTPDEFMVVKRAPLEMPSDFTALPTPQPGAQRPQELSAKQQAQVAVTGEAAPVLATAPSSAESALLSKAGATQADPAIRRVVNKETVENTEDKRSVVKRLLDFGSTSPSATIVDPAKEAERLKANKAAGKPVTAGETPTVEE